MDNKKEIREQVAQVVEDLFNQKEEAEIRKQTEAELQKAASTVSDLTSALEDKNGEAADYEQKLSDSETRITELTSELEAAKSELETATTELAETKTDIEKMRKDRAAEIRMAELEGAGVVNSNRENQMEKVREMSDEAFASYKEELESVRASVIAELKAASEEAGKEAKAEETDAKAKAEEVKKPEDSEEASEESEEDDSTAPAQVKSDLSAMASLNLESTLGKDKFAKYKELGKALAESWVK